MTSPLRFQPVGPISSGDTIILTAFTGGQVYIALYDETVSDAIFYPWLQYNAGGSINPVITSDNILQFVATGSYASLSLEASNTKGAGRKLLYSVASDGTPQTKLMQQTSPPTTLAVISKYQSPSPPSVLLASADYTLATSSGTHIKLRYYPYNSSAVSVVQTPVYAVPVKQFHKSAGDMSTFTCSPVQTDSFGAARVWVCSSAETRGSGAIQNCSGVTGNSWTTLADCQRDQPYNYCTGSETCGPCYGICEVSAEVCSASTGTTFTCPSSGGGGGGGSSLDPLQPATDTDSDSTWWIVFIVVAIVLLIIIVALVHHSSSSTPRRRHRRRRNNFAQPVPTHAI